MGEYFDAIAQRSLPLIAVADCTYRWFRLAEADNLGSSDKFMFAAKLIKAR